MWRSSPWSWNLGEGKLQPIGADVSQLRGGAPWVWYPHTSQQNGLQPLSADVWLSGGGRGVDAIKLFLQVLQIGFRDRVSKKLQLLEWRRDPRKSPKQSGSLQEAHRKKHVLSSSILLPGPASAPLSGRSYKKAATRELWFAELQLQCHNVEHRKVGLELAQTTPLATQHPYAPFFTHLNFQTINSLFHLTWCNCPSYKWRYSHTLHKMRRSKILMVIVAVFSLC